MRQVRQTVSFQTDSAYFVIANFVISITPHSANPWKLGHGEGLRFAPIASSSGAGPPIDLTLTGVVRGHCFLWVRRSCSTRQTLLSDD